MDCLRTGPLLEVFIFCFNTYYVLRIRLVVAAASFSFFNELQEDLGHRCNKLKPSFRITHTHPLSCSTRLSVRRSVEISGMHRRKLVFRPRMQPESVLLFEVVLLWLLEAISRS